MLHKLPKDILIQLITKVQKRCENDKRELLKKCNKSKVYACGYEGCKEFEVISHNRILIFSSAEQSMSTCSWCNKRFCDVHNCMFTCNVCKLPQCLFDGSNYCLGCRYP